MDVGTWATGIRERTHYRPLGPLTIETMALVLCRRDHHRADHGSTGEPMTGGPADRDYLMSLPSKRMAVGVIFCDDQDRILIVFPTYRDRWQLPGGVVEADESPAGAAAREVEEELGLDLHIGRPLVIRWLPPRLDPRGAVVIDYDGGILSPKQIASIRLPADELSAFQFVPADAMAALTTLGTADRVTHALHARQTGSVVELDDHRPRT